MAKLRRMSSGPRVSLYAEPPGEMAAQQICAQVTYGRMQGIRAF